MHASHQYPECLRSVVDTFGCLAGVGVHIDIHDMKAHAVQPFPVSFQAIGHADAQFDIARVEVSDAHACRGLFHVPLGLFVHEQHMRQLALIFAHIIALAGGSFIQALDGVQSYPFG